MTLPLHPVLPKKIPLAIASLRANTRTSSTFSWNFRSSSLFALEACTVRKAESDSCATSNPTLELQARGTSTNEVPWSFHLELPVSYSIGVLSIGHKRPESIFPHISKRMWEFLGMLLTAPSETGGTTANISIVSCGEM